MLKVKIFGACGYGGVGIIELLLKHPHAEIVSLIDIENCGMPISSIYPHLSGFCDLPITAPDDDDPGDGRSNSLFFATPDGVAMKRAARYVEKGLKVIDYSGDFRFSSSADYDSYAQRIGRPAGHSAEHLMEGSVYGLAELNRAAISKACIVGNPGCFAVATILSLAPLVKAKAVDLSRLICDAKTGVSGAGKKPSPAFHYPARYENMNAYKIGKHQHVIETEKQLSLLAGADCKIMFNTQVLPITRGIMSCAYAQVDAQWSASQIFDLFKDFYHDEPFVRVLPPDQPPCSKDVRGSNFCLLTAYLDQRTGICLVVCQIDNLVKGQAGSALQNMNIMHGLDERLGLNHPPMVP